ncbi:MAG TPA: hypothetical protein VF604_04100 [Pyrinomonadaceae bacterium]
MSISLVAMSQEQEAIPIIAALLADEDDRIRGAAAISLIKMAEVSEDLRRQIEQISFPKAAVISAKGRSLEVPIWLRIKEDS